jgi:hypothetical protein
VTAAGIYPTAKPVALATMVSAGAGAHQITLFHDTSDANLASGALSADSRVIAIAIG